MDLDSYWQENKRFVMSVVGGVVVFLIVWGLIDSNLGKDLASMNARRSRLRQDLTKSMFGTADLDRAKQENSALREAVALLRPGGGRRDEQERQQQGGPPRRRTARAQPARVKTLDSDHRRGS